VVELQREIARIKAERQAELDEPGIWGPAKRYGLDSRAQTVYRWCRRVVPPAAE
jgi:hypothetical protein